MYLQSTCLSALSLVQFLFLSSFISFQWLGKLFIFTLAKALHLLRAWSHIHNAPPTPLALQNCGVQALMLLRRKDMKTLYICSPPTALFSDLEDSLAGSTTKMAAPTIRRWHRGGEDERRKELAEDVAGRETWRGLIYRQVLILALILLSLKKWEGG